MLKHSQETRKSGEKVPLVVVDPVPVFFSPGKLSCKMSKCNCIFQILL